MLEGRVFLPLIHLNEQLALSSEIATTTWVSHESTGGRPSTGMTGPEQIPQCAE